MKTEKQKQGKTIAVVAALLVCAYVARRIGKQTPDMFLDIALQLIRNLIHIGLLMAWMVSVKRRILQRQIRETLLLAAGLMMFWLYIKGVKWNFFPGNLWPGRYLWYMYYIPMVLIPLFGVFLVQQISLPEDQIFSGKIRWLYLPAGLLIGLILTNDFHEKVFAFPKGKAEFNGVYTHEAGYYLTAAWCLGLGIYFVAGLVKKSRKSGRAKMKAIPMLVLAGAVGCSVVYNLHLLNPQPDITVVECLMIVLLFEGCIQSGLIRSNSRYEALFQASTIEAQIVDESYRICYASEYAKTFSKAQMQKAESAPVFLEN